MTRRQFSFLLGLLSQSGCIVYDDNIRRPTSDAADDVVRDAGPVGREATSDGSRIDVAVVDAEAILDTRIDVDGVSDAARADTNDTPELDAGDGRDVTSDQFLDAVIPPEVAPDVRFDTVDVGGEGDASNIFDTGVDPTTDPPTVDCAVDFTVSGVTWDVESAADAGEGGSRVVRLVGDIGPLGAWSPTSGLAMTEKAPGAWSTTIWLADHLTIEFKFVKLDDPLPPEWEAWLPADSNRSLRVDCGADGGTIWVDAATEAGPANRAVGRSYGGAFGVRPLDATK
jgi:hypothetical protein